MIFTICNCKIVKLNKMHMLLIVTTGIDILLSMKKYMSRSKQIIYLCNIHFIPISYYCYVFSFFSFLFFLCIFIFILILCFKFHVLLELFYVLISFFFLCFIIF